MARTIERSVRSAFCAPVAIVSAEEAACDPSVHTHKDLHYKHAGLTRSIDGRGFKVAMQLDLKRVDLGYTGTTEKGTLKVPGLE
jgi:hypothetical protein